MDASDFMHLDLLTLSPPDGKPRSIFLPSELLKEIFLYGIEANQMKFGDLAPVCRHWRAVATSISTLWSTLRVGTWTEREQVENWQIRGYPRKVVIDTERDDQIPSNTPFDAFQDVLASTMGWNELTISSFPPENLASQLNFQDTRPMYSLRTLHVVAGCVPAPSFTRLLDLIPTGAPLSELRLHPSFASTYFLQPPWFPILQNLTVLIVNGRGIHEPVGLLPAFTQLHTFEADRLSLPWYELNIDLPLLRTLQKLRLRASSVQWMAGRTFECLEECAILLPHRWQAVQQREVQMPSCRKLTFHGYPLTTLQCFRGPQLRAMVLGSPDWKEQRVSRQLHHLYGVNGSISKLTTLHVTFQCSEQVLLKVLVYLVPLQELVLSVAHPSPSWEQFLVSLAAKPSTNDSPEWGRDIGDQQWEQWCSSQTWHANVLPHLKYLSIQCSQGFSRSEYLDNFPLLRLVGWTRAQLTPPLEHLKVSEGRGTTGDIVVDFISTGYLDMHPGLPSKAHDSMIVKGMLTQRLEIRDASIPLFQLHYPVLFRRLQDLEINCYRDHEIPILPWLEEIKRLSIWHGVIPAYSLDINLPLIHTLQWLELDYSPFSWMLGRTFKALMELHVGEPPDTPENQSRHEGFMVDLPACTRLDLWDVSVNRLSFLSCPKLHNLRLQGPLGWFAIGETGCKSLRDFLRNCSGLQKFKILLSQDLGLDSFIQFVLCDAWEQGVQREIRDVEVKIRFTALSRDDAYHFFSQVVGHQPHYKNRWKEFTVTREDWAMVIKVRASM